MVSAPALPMTNSPWVGELAKQVDNTARVLCESTEKDQAANFDSYEIALHTKAPLLVGVRSESATVPWVFSGGRLNGRAMADWSDEELSRFVTRWNIGWLVTQSPAASARFERLGMARRLDLTGLPNDVRVYAMDRPHRFVIKGVADWSVNEQGNVTLRNIVPENGEIVLSLRYHRTWELTPATATLDVEVDPYDAWPIIRIRLNGPLDELILRHHDR